jgi:two-component system, LytTR family, sensor kinase
MKPGQSPSVIGFFPRSRVLRHILFWLWVYVMDVLIFGFGYQNISLFLKLSVLEMPPQILFAYVVMYWILPRHRKRNKPLETVGFIFITFLVSGIIGHLLFLPFSGYSTPTSVWDIAKIMVRGFYAVLQGGLAIVIKLAIMWYANEKRVSDMEKNNLESELKMLKDQVNPHFMFNTLNNLYGLVGRNPLQAQESILRLSGILHFMLHESNYPTVPLHLEIRCINDFIELEKLRYTDSLSISFNVEDEVRDLSLVPLTIFPFVENSFKHGASELIRDAWVNIDLSVYRDEFIFKIENSKSPTRNPNSTGIGLNNVKRRLELIYGKDHKLQILDGTDSYLVILKIALTRMEKNHLSDYESEMSYR